MNSCKASLLLVINSPGIRKTIRLLHKIVNLAKYVQLYGVTSLMPSLRKRCFPLKISPNVVLVCITEKPRFEMNIENK